MATIKAIVTRVTIMAIVGKAVVINRGNTHMTGNKIIDLDTSASGTPFVTFGSYSCTNVYIVNSTDFAIDVQRDGAGAFITIPALQDYDFGGLANASQIGVRRTDQSTSQLTIMAEAYS